MIEIYFTIKEIFDLLNIDKLYCSRCEHEVNSIMEHYTSCRHLSYTETFKISIKCSICREIPIYNFRFIRLIPYSCFYACIPCYNNFMFIQSLVE